MQFDDHWRHARRLQLAEMFFLFHKSDGRWLSRIVIWSHHHCGASKQAGRRLSMVLCSSTHTNTRKWHTHDIDENTHKQARTHARETQIYEFERLSGQATKYNTRTHTHTNTRTKRRKKSTFAQKKTVKLNADGICQNGPSQIAHGLVVLCHTQTPISQNDRKKRVAK